MDKCFEDMNVIKLSPIEEQLSCIEQESSYDDIEQEVSYYDVMREEDGRHYGLGM